MSLAEKRGPHTNGLSLPNWQLTILPMMLGGEFNHQVRQPSSALIGSGNGGSRCRRVMPHPACRYHATVRRIELHTCHLSNKETTLERNSAPGWTLIPGTKQVREGPGAAHQQRPPRQLGGLEPVALRRVQDPAVHVEVAPLRPEELAALEHAHQLVGRVRNSNRAGLPVAHDAIGDPQQLGAGFDAQTALEAGFPKAPCRHRKPLPFLPVGVSYLGRYNFA